jgi:hypothetical protein
LVEDFIPQIPRLACQGSHNEVSTRQQGPRSLGVSPVQCFHVAVAGGDCGEVATAGSFATKS